jgi:hypothetical protein
MEQLLKAGSMVVPAMDLFDDSWQTKLRRREGDWQRFMPWRETRGRLAKENPR